MGVGDLCRRDEKERAVGILGSDMEQQETVGTGIVEEPEADIVLLKPPPPTIDLFPVVEEEQEKKPWILTTCEVCGHDIQWDSPIGPGETAVVQCLQCATRWAAVLPSVQIVLADPLGLREDELISDGTTEGL